MGIINYMGKKVAYESLKDKIDCRVDPVEFLREVPGGAYQCPVRCQFANWQDEQRSWREANAEDVVAVERSILTGIEPGKYMETPSAHYLACLIEA
jgi:hypothetical protein